MKGSIENTIPQRQYENIKTTYYFENEKERIECIKQSIKDCKELYGITKKEVETKKEYKIIGGEPHYLENGVYKKEIKNGKT